MSGKKQASIFARTADQVEVQAFTSPEVWAAENRVYGSTSGVPGPRDPYLSPSLVPLGIATVSSRYRRVVAVTSTQMGKTDTELDIIGQRLDQRPVPIIYVGPSVDFNKDQFEPRLRSMIDECKSLTGKLVRGRREKKTFKIVSGVKVRLASGQSSTALKSDPAGLAIVDEYDEMVANIRGQGDVLGLVEARGETYADFLTVVTSTPSVGIVESEKHIVGQDEAGRDIEMEFWAFGDPQEIESPIWRLFQEGTRHHWAWHCPHCNVPFIPMRKHLKWDPGATPIQANRSAFLVCPHNGCVIEDNSEECSDYRQSVRAKMNASGFMIAPGQTIEDAKSGSSQIENSTYSQWSSGLASPFVTWGLRAERMVKAEMSGEPDKIQTAVNANFGEVYAPSVSGDMPDWQALLKHRGDYAPDTLPRGVLRVVMGVDVQQRGLYFVIRGFGSRGTRWLIRHGYLIGETSQDDVWIDLSDIMLSPVGGMHIEKVFIDSGFRPDKKGAGSPHKVYDFCRQYSFIATPCKGRSTSGGRPYTVSKIEVKPDGAARAYSLNLGLLDTDFFKSLVFSRIKTPLEAPGAFHLHGEADEDYARQVISEARLVEPGRAKAIWKKLRQENHLLDCEALCAAAAYTLNVQAIPEGLLRPVLGDTEDDEPHMAHVSGDAEKEQVKQNSMSDLRSRLSRSFARPRGLR